MADPGQDPRGAPDLDPLWRMLDLTLHGRGLDWYPKLGYGGKKRSFRCTRGKLPICLGPRIGFPQVGGLSHRALRLR